MDYFMSVNNTNSTFVKHYRNCSDCLKANNDSLFERKCRQECSYLFFDIFYLVFVGCLIVIFITAIYINILCNIKKTKRNNNHESV